MRFVLTDAQMMSGSMSEPKFVEWFCHSILKENFPDEWIDLGPDICRTYTTNGLKYARHFGIQRLDLQAQYISLMWLLAPNMHEVQTIGAILYSDHTEIKKLEALNNMHDSVAEAAVENCDMLHWYPEEIEGNILGIPVEDMSGLVSEFPFLELKAVSTDRG